MKIFVSNGLRGKADPKGYVEKCRAAVDKKYPNGERIDSFFKDFDGRDKYHEGRQPGCWISEEDFDRIARESYRYGNWYVNVGEIG